MRIILICSIVLALTACDERGARIPIDNSTGFRDGYLVQVRRAGDIEWNGQKLDDAEFDRYLQQYAAMPKGAGRLWVEFEPKLHRAGSPLFGSISSRAGSASIRDAWKDLGTRHGLWPTEAV
ncbi:hypothetical protein KFK14_23445 [Sphingobium phenoxybenzoativorans]|uniref:Uncharacterized protein n=1 Tax=Sphingobium phenoxybenzoativorans TaxID=1592790 RepID=A0A975K6S6_9SPHN|nr:hypothetical protein [Sphingobium phenoxybenzoativorans]QUT05851.1 hypothetical protein KFK14_23445 [Sphingobium phenoxybenzoativorans]